MQQRPRTHVLLFKQSRGLQHTGAHCRKLAAWYGNDTPPRALVRNPSNTRTRSPCFVFGPSLTLPRIAGCCRTWRRNDFCTEPERHMTSHSILFGLIRMLPHIAVHYRKLPFAVVCFAHRRKLSSRASNGGKLSQVCRTLS